jgi:hypothetical protein
MSQRLQPSDAGVAPFPALSLQLHAGRRGYLLRSGYVAGFADRRELDDPDRRLLAEWARAFTPDALSLEQSQLLTLPLLALSTTEVQLRDAAITNAERDLPHAVDLGLYGQLSAEEVRLVREPWLRLPGSPKREYPLNVGDLARLTAVSENQIHAWAEHDLMPTHRVGGRWYFFSAAAVHIFALRQLDSNALRNAARVLAAAK